MLYYDMLYILPPLILTLIASAAVKITYSRYAKVKSASGITASQAARQILDANGLTHIRIEPIAGDLTDHFDPQSGVIRLSDTVRDSTSIAAIGVAAHECGHAIQYAKQYAPIRLRAAIIPATGVASRLAVPLVFIGAALSFYARGLLSLAYAGIILFGICVAVSADHFAGGIQRQPPCTADSFLRGNSVRAGNRRSGQGAECRRHDLRGRSGRIRVSADPPGRLCEPTGSIERGAAFRCSSPFFCISYLSPALICPFYYGIM